MAVLGSGGLATGRTVVRHLEGDDGLAGKTPGVGTRPLVLRRVPTVGNGREPRPARRLVPAPSTRLPTHVVGQTTSAGPAGLVTAGGARPTKRVAEALPSAVAAACSPVLGLFPARARAAEPGHVVGAIAATVLSPAMTDPVGVHVVAGPDVEVIRLLAIPPVDAAQTPIRAPRAVSVLRPLRLPPEPATTDEPRQQGAPSARGHARLGLPASPPTVQRAPTARLTVPPDVKRAARVAVARPLVSDKAPRQTGAPASHVPSFATPPQPRTVKEAETGTSAAQEVITPRPVLLAEGGAPPVPVAVVRATAPASRGEAAALREAHAGTRPGRPVPAQTFIRRDDAIGHPRLVPIRGGEESRPTGPFSFSPRHVAPQLFDVVLVPPLAFSLLVVALLILVGVAPPHRPRARPIAVLMQALVALVPVVLVQLMLHVPPRE